MPNTPEYLAWRDMIRRCTDPADKDYGSYGGRGISVCPDWLQSYDEFLEAVGMKPQPAMKYVLARKDINGHYEPSNVAWALRSRQMANSRKLRMLLVDGEKLNLTDTARKYGMSKHTLRQRMDWNGMTAEQAVRMPVGKPPRATVAPSTEDDARACLLAIINCPPKRRAVMGASLRAHPKELARLISECPGWEADLYHVEPKILLLARRLYVDGWSITKISTRLKLSRKRTEKLLAKPEGWRIRPTGKEDALKLLKGVAHA